MALIDVSFLMTDPDFVDSVTLIQRSVNVNGYGENVMTETSSTIIASMQGVGTEMLDKLPEGARLSDSIYAYSKTPLSAERPGGYADIVVWQGKRYQVREVLEDMTNFGGGFTKAICILEAVSV